MTTQQILNYGGGWQTVGLCVLIGQGKIARPDRIIIADTGREKTSTWDYLEEVTRPAMARVGLEVEIAPRNLAYVDIYSHNGILLLPAYTATGKMTAFCSTEWKASVIGRHVKLGDLGYSPDAIRAMTSPEIQAAMKQRTAQQYTSWIGFTYDERKRVKGTEGRAFPLIDAMLTKADIRAIVRAAGWPDPVASSCYMCPNMRNEEWRYIRDTYPADFAQACQIDDEIRENDERGGVWLHHSRVPLREADLSVEDRKEASRQCGLGMCFI